MHGACTSGPRPRVVLHAATNGGSVPRGLSLSDREPGEPDAADKSAAVEWSSDVRIVMFYHSLVSDWNHGNAHFLRGVVSELLSKGHDVDLYEPADGWSRANLVKDHGLTQLDEFNRHYPELGTNLYELATLDLDEILHNADLVIVHEWNDKALVNRIGRHHARHDSYCLLFHDTHHRAVSSPEEMAAYDLSG